MNEAVFRYGGTHYTNLLARIRARRVPLSQLQTHACGRRYAVRHDVDHSLERALLFARMEKSIGVQAAYFLLHTAPYFTPAMVRSAASELRDLGHEVGLHHDILTSVAAGSTEPASDMLRRALDVIGGPVTAVSAHGSVDGYRFGFRNYELWYEFDPSKNEAGGGPRVTEPLSLSVFGLEYEAYFLKHDHYLTDSAKVWASWAKELPRPFERMRLRADNPGQRVIKLFNQEPDATLQLLVHPCHWHVSQV